MKRRYVEGNKLGRPVRPIGEIPKDPVEIKRCAEVTHFFLEHVGRKIDAYEHVRDNGDILGFKGEQGIGVIVFLTNGFYSVQKSSRIAMYDQDFKRINALEGNICHVVFEPAIKYYYVAPKGQGLIDSGEECWFTIQDSPKFGVSMTQDLLEKGLYRITHEQFIEHVGKVLANPMKEISKWEALPKNGCKKYKFVNQGDYHTYNRRKKQNE